MICNTPGGREVAKEVQILYVRHGLPNFAAEMKTALLFNPENDLALALGCRHYTPPPHAAAIHRAGALLPLWWAGEDDTVIADGDLCEEASRLCGRFGLRGRVDTGAGDADRAEPWGWSLDARRQFVRAGVREEALPDEAAVGRMRELSHRRMSVEILRRLDGDYHLPLETTDPRLVVEAEHRSPGCYVKSPWSGSGRGVFCARSLTDEALLRRAEGIIHRQGSVMVERGLDKVLDFAALFHSDGRRVEFRGLSVFATEARGMYSGNIVAPQEFLREKIASLTDFDSLMLTIRAEESILSDLVAPDYSGWLGVDMMIHREGGENRVMPCVELNLRRTMGVVALDIASRLDIDRPHFLTWEHNKEKSGSVEEGMILLPPTDGFSLRLRVGMHHGASDNK